MSQNPRILVVGAHPDDCDLKAGGTAILASRAGQAVRFLSVTNGQSGHHRLPPDRVQAIRRDEARAAGAILGVEYHVLDFPDGTLQPTLAARHALLKQIRSFAPHVLLTHRPNDYHPDHRATSQLVTDAVALLRVPRILPDVPIPETLPIVGFLADAFTKPAPFEPGVLVDITDVLETLVDALHCHQSQFYEWLPYNRCYAKDIPADESARREWLAGWFRQRIEPLSQQCASRIAPHRTATERFYEAFEISDCGRTVTLDEARSGFPQGRASCVRGS